MDFPEGVLELFLDLFILADQLKSHRILCPGLDDVGNLPLFCSPLAKAIPAPLRDEERVVYLSLASLIVAPPAADIVKVERFYFIRQAREDLSHAF